MRYLETLRAKRLTDAYTAPGKRAFYGLLPESVSHEGYASRPVHAYWDDFFALRGLKDAVVLAQAVGEDRRGGGTFAALRDGLQHDLHASIASGHRRAQARLRPGLGRAGRLRPQLDRDRASRPPAS